MSANDAQKQFWSDVAGAHWVDLQDIMDATLKPVLDLVLEHANLNMSDSVLDVGCGAGTSTIAAAEHVGPKGSVLGIDISDTLLSTARELAQGADNTSFLLADAQSYEFEPQKFDHLISRFGVMFFEDTTTAFANMARGLKPGATLTMGTWGPAPNNPWFMIPAKVAAKRLGSPPKTDRTLPGPFAWEDQRRTAAMLDAAGLKNVTVSTHHLHLTPPHGLKELADQCFAIGPVSGVIDHFDGNDADVAAIHAGIMEAFAPFETAQGLQIPADINLFQATT